MKSPSFQFFRQNAKPLAASKYCGILVLIFSLFLTSMPHTLAAVVVPSDTVSLGLFLKDNFEVGNGPSRIYGFDSDPDLAIWCSPLESEACTKATNAFGEVNWDLCMPNSKLECISEVWAIDPTGKKIAGEYVRNAPAEKTYDFEENLPLKLPKSRGMGTVWRFPGAINSSGSDTYFVSVRSSLWMKKNSGVPVADASFEVGPPIAAIAAVQEMRGNFQPVVPTDVSRGGRAVGIGGGSALGDGSTCIAIGYSDCQKVVQLPENFRFGMKIKNSRKINGWFHGRFLEPSILTEETSDGTSLSIEAAPVKVPSLDFMVPNSQIPEAARQLIFNNEKWGQSGGPQTGIKINDDPSGPHIFDLLRVFLPAYKDKATSTDTQWSFKTLNYFESNKVGQCTSQNSELAGLVTTNALGYSPGPPNFSSVTGSLEYKVASPHLEANGKVALGTYDLSLRSDIARCIYGFSNAPIKAEISIMGDEGENRVATTTVNERDGWLYLSAKGFTFSAPKIQVKLSQDAPPPVEVPKKEEISSVASPTTPVAVTAITVAPSKIIKKKTSITCVKGKSTRKVTGFSPKCPAGFKKK
jgi:hypothetical protein